MRKLLAAFYKELLLVTGIGLTAAAPIADSSGRKPGVGVCAAPGAIAGASLLAVGTALRFERVGAWLNVRIRNSDRSEDRQEDASRLGHEMLVVLGLLGTFGLRIAFLDKYGLWDGELHTVFHALRPLSEFPAGLREYAAHPPLWFVLTHLLMDAQPAVLWVMRFPAALMGTLSVAAGYVLARRFFPRRWALMVLWLLAISPVWLRWSQSVRMYAAFGFFSTLSFYFVLRMLEERHKLAWIGFGLATLLNLYTHYFAIFPMMAAIGFIAIAVLGSLAPSVRGKSSSAGQAPASSTDGRSSHPRSWLVVRRALRAGGLVAVLYWPWYWWVARFNFIQRQTAREAVDSRTAIDELVFYRLFQDLTGGVALFTWVMLFLVLAGVVLLLMRRRYHQVSLMILGIIVPMAAVLLTNPRRFHAKYVVHAIPPLAILIVAGVLALRDLTLLLGARTKFGHVVSSGMVVTLLTLSSVPSLWIDYHYYEGSPEIHETSTEPRVWVTRGSFLELIQHVQNGNDGFLFVLQDKGYKNREKQLRLHLKLSPGAHARLQATDWTQADEFDLWWISNSDSDKDVRKLLEGLGDVPLGQHVLNGQNGLNLWHASMRVTSAENILANGSFEMGSSAEKWRESAAGASWHVGIGPRAAVRLVSEPVVDGSNALAISAQHDVEVASDPLPIEAGTLLHITMQVKNPTLQLQEVTPELRVRFLDVQHERVKATGSWIMYYVIPSSTGSGPEGWQQVTAQAVAPAEARYVVIEILAEASELEEDRTLFVDDVRVVAVQWEPEA